MNRMASSHGNNDGTSHQDRAQDQTQNHENENDFVHVNADADADADNHPHLQSPNAAKLSIAKASSPIQYYQSPYLPSSSLSLPSPSKRPLSTPQKRNTSYNYNNKTPKIGTTTKTTTKTNTSRSPSSRINSNFKGTTIKNVNGKGEDYVPFVGCDIDDLIANLNRSSSYGSSHGGSGDSHSGGGGGNGTGTGTGGRHSGKGGTNGGSSKTPISDASQNTIVTSGGSIRSIMSPPGGNRKRHSQQSRTATLNPNENLEFPIIESPPTKKSHKSKMSDINDSIDLDDGGSSSKSSSALSNVMGSPSSVELFNVATSNDDDVNATNPNANANARPTTPTPKSKADANANAITPTHGVARSSSNNRSIGSKHSKSSSHYHHDNDNHEKYGNHSMEEVEEDDNSTIATIQTNMTLTSFLQHQKKKVRLIVGDEMDDDDDDINNYEDEDRVDFMKKMLLHEHKKRVSMSQQLQPKQSQLQQPLMQLQPLKKSKQQQQGGGSVSSHKSKSRRRKKNGSSLSVSSSQSQQDKKLRKQRKEQKLKRLLQLQQEQQQQQQQSQQQEERQQQQPQQDDQQQDQWESFWSTEHDCPYYHNKYTDEVTWENPTIPSKPVYDDESVPMVDFTAPKKEVVEDNTHANPSVDTNNAATDKATKTRMTSKDNGKDGTNNDLASQKSVSLPITSSTSMEQWERYWSDEHGCDYYHNPNTGEVRWDNPNKKSYTTGSIRSSRSKGTSRSRRGRGRERTVREEDSAQDDTNQINSPTSSGEESYEYEDEQLVQISDFTSKRSIISEGCEEDQDCTNNKNNDDGTANGLHGGKGADSNDESNDADSSERWREIAIAVEYMIHILGNIIRRVRQRLYQQSIYDISSDRPITGADLAYQRKVNLLRNRRRKRRMKRGSVALSIFIVLFYILSYGFNSLRSVELDSDSTTLLSSPNSNSSATDITNDLIQLKDETPPLGVTANDDTDEEIEKNIIEDLMVKEKLDSEVEGKEKPKEKRFVLNYRRKDKDGSSKKKDEPVSEATTKSRPDQSSQAEELQKLSLSINESLNLIQSATIDVDQDKNEKLDILGRKLDELKRVLEQAREVEENQDEEGIAELKKGSTLAKVESKPNTQHDTNSKSRDEKGNKSIQKPLPDSKENKNTRKPSLDAKETKSSQKAPHDKKGKKSIPKHLPDVKDEKSSQKAPHDKKEKKNTQKPSPTVKEKKKIPNQHDEKKNAQKSKKKEVEKKEINVPSLPVMKEKVIHEELGESRKIDETHIMKPNSQVQDHPIGDIPTVTKKEVNEVQKVLSGAHYFDKFQNVIQTLGMALDIHLDIEDMGDFELSDEKAMPDAKLSQKDNNLGDQLTKAMKNVVIPIQRQSMKTAEHISMQMKKSMPEVHRSIEIGAKHSLQTAEKLASTVKKTAPVGAKFVADNGKKAIENIIHTMEIINNNEQVIAAKDVVRTTANAAAKRTIKETVAYLETLDYDDLTESGVISKSVIFPDTRAIHCQVPFLKHLNKRCERFTTVRASPPDLMDWASSFQKRFFSTENAPSPSSNGGWSVPIWKSCHGGSCEQPVSAPNDFNSDSKTAKKWDNIMSKVIPKECKNTRKDGSRVDIECLADFSS